ncbi:hypothetical protein SUGI_0811910 [Cryptomeria japonica]|uniref:NF-X1-type zinc finger protein NFXL1-like n=1 Tax=Cryptomeria japonica TaxID=3369 RepID=UPI002414957D|nr:NF-X1-type zinc finger protein NFXL1-like [Cryptomeria japonica]GLJ39714.1 hypothetical protein SUGI_0811910 [Cryptomeria japonica]
MEMGASTEDVKITNNSGRQNSYGNNGRRAWIPRGRGNHNQNPNPNTNGRRVWTPRGRGRASKCGHNSSAHDLVLPMNDRKHPSQSVHHKRSEMEDLGLMNRSNSQDWRYHAPSSEVNARPLLKQESEEVIHLERSNVPNLVQEIERKLQQSKVECMICYEMVGKSAAIWSCNSCYALFHLHCIRKWARAPTSRDLSAGQSQRSNWRCPGCQSVQYSRPEDLQYYCFCGKMQNPYNDFYLTPHSCGEPCGKSLDKGKEMSRCPHTCTLLCHPGPCPPCTAMAAPQPCPCGKKTITRRCSDQKSAESCGQVCEQLLTCGRHLCDKICHEGPCGSCTILINASCFCGKKENMMLCGDLEFHGELEWKSGVYACENLCMKMLSCQKHNCSLGCHPGECKECDLLPEKLKTCPCGKTQILNQRKSCLDPVPTCSEVCEKLLPCGKHKCINSCHQGICPPCLVSVDHKCRCGSSSRKVSCWKTTSVTEDNKEFLCEKVCGQKKNCGRHRCNEKCCPLSHRGRSDIQTGDWDPHLCLMPCGKKMRCGQHYCQELCHSGYCPPCLETNFTDLSCACGKTSIPPPVPCGTPIPSCAYPCSIPQPCGHSATHNCHLGECPPCTASAAKKCVGSHVILRNVLCGSREIRCNKLCGKTRQCGMHACTRTCHIPPCDTVSMESSSSKARISCGQTCGATRRDCKHTCISLCHPSRPCPDTRCTFPVTITCSCGRMTAKVPCHAGGNNIRADPVFEASIYHKLPAPLQPTESHLTRVPMGQRKLACDDECAKLERKKTLANAFDISTTVDVQEVNGKTSEMLADLIRREPQWVSDVEDRFKYLVLGRTKINTNGIRVHIFNAVPKEKRDILKLLAGRWNLSVFWAGWEPRRFLIVQVTQKSRAPARNLLLNGPLQTTGQVQPPIFNSLVDMDPRLVFALFGLPRETDVSVSSLILRFGGECELVWLNDKNALAIFTDMTRAATAMRRVAHATAYQGAVNQTSTPIG